MIGAPRRKSKMCKLFAISVILFATDLHQWHSQSQTKFVEAVKTGKLTQQSAQNVQTEEDDFKSYNNLIHSIVSSLYTPDEALSANSKKELAKTEFVDQKKEEKDHVLVDQKKEEKDKVLVDQKKEEKEKQFVDQKKPKMQREFVESMAEIRMKEVPEYAYPKEGDVPIWDKEQSTIDNPAPKTYNPSILTDEE